MSKLNVATRLADELGGSVDEAMRWVDEVGVDRARAAADDAAQAGDNFVQRWWKPATAVGGVGGAGVLAYRQQDIQEAKAIADQQQQYSDAAKSVLGSDLSAKAKQDALDQLRASSPAAAGNQNGNSNDGGGILGGDIQTTIILLVVLAFTLRYALDSPGGGSA